MPLCLLPDLMTSTQIPGMSVATVENGKASEHLALGIADTGKDSVVTDKTLFDAASLSKPVFAYLVLKLVAEGVLSLDQPLCQLTDVTIGDNVDYANLLTARLVLSHQTGLPNWAKQNETPSFAFKPGTGYGYSGEAYLYLQKIIEKRTGKSLETLAHEKVFGPLGMIHSHFDWPADSVSNMASPHDAMMVVRPLPVGRPANAAASLWTTANDYAKFIEAWLNNNDPKLRGFLDEALTPQVWMTQDPKAPDSLSVEVLSHVGWGMGWGLNKTPQGDLIAFQYGDNGNAKAFVAINLATRAAMVYFANSVNGLAIAQQAVASSVGDISHAIQYLGYETYGEHWQARFEALKAGQEAEVRGEYATAVHQFQQAVALYPNDKVTVRRIQWLNALIHHQQAPFTPEKPLALYVGHYGHMKMPVEIALEQSQLYLVIAKKKFAITPLSDNYFAVGTDSRIHFNFDDQGRPNQLHSVFLNGDEDLSSRLHNPLLQEQADKLIQPRPLNKVHLEKLEKPAIRRIMRESEIHGMSVAVVDSQGNISSMGMGMDPDAMTLEALQFRPTTQAGVASLSKVVFAYLVLKLIEKHPELGFDLDTPLHTIVATDSERFGHDVAKAHALTARLVLSHQTGLPIWTDVNKPMEFAFKPGKAYAYSGPSFVYLQKVIEQLTGSTLEELAQTLVFAPLHMHHSTFLDVDNVNDPTSSSRPKIACAANSLQTTTEDYMRFVFAWLHDEVLQYAFKSEVSMTKDAWAQETLSDEDLVKVAWGLGWGLQMSSEGKAIAAFHHGDMSDRRAFVVLDLQTKTAGIVISNGPNGHLLNQETLFTLFDVKEIASYFFGKFPFARTFKELKPDWREKPSWGLRADEPVPTVKLLIELPSLQTQLEAENRLTDHTRHPYGSGAMVPYNPPDAPQLKVLVISPEPTVALRSRLDQMAHLTPKITILNDEGLDALTLSQQSYDLVLIDENAKQSAWQLNQQWIENTHGEKPLFYLVGDVDPLIAREAKALGFSGSVCVLKDNQVLTHQAFGARSTAALAAANTTETKFNIGSIGKMFTAAAIVKLAADKGLDFHQPIVDFLPKDCPYKHLFQDFTLHELLTHTSGLKGGAQEFFFKENMLHFNQLQDHIPWLEDGLAQASTSQHRGVHVYSNRGFFILGLAIEAISSQSFFAYIQQNILQPAQMAYTTFRREACDENLALPTVKKPRETTWLTPGFLAGQLNNSQHLLHKEANMAEQALHFIERYTRSIDIDGLLNTYQTALSSNGDLDTFKQSFSLMLAESYQKVAHHPDMIDRISKIGSALHDKLLPMKVTDPLYQETKTLDDLLFSTYQYLNWQLQTLHSFANSLSIAHPAGCWYSTSQDLLAFHNALTQPEGALRSCYDVMTAHKVLFDKDQPLIGYGYGMTVDDAISCQGHNGGVPGGLANYYTYPTSGFTVVTLSNSDDQPIFPSLQHHLVLGDKQHIKYFSTQLNPDVEDTFLSDLTAIQAKKTSPVETPTLNS